MNKLTRLSIAAVLAVTLLAVMSVGLLTGMLGTPSWAEAQETEPAVIPLGPEVRHIDPRPWGLMYRHAAEEEGLPANIDLTILVDKTITTATSLSDQITQAGGRHISGNDWRVPLAALTPVVQRADVTVVRVVPGATGQIPTTPAAYGRMVGPLESVLRSVDEEVPDTQAALKAFIAKDGKVGIVIDATSSSQETLIRNWLTRNGITGIDEVAGADTSDHLTAAMVPVGKVVALSDEFTTARLYTEGYDDQDVTSVRSTWSVDYRAYENDLIAFFTSGTVPSWATYGTSTRTSSATSKPWDDGLTERLTAHGVVQWRGSDEFVGEDIKVGIIDWGFSGLNQTPGLEDLDTWHETRNTNGNAFCQKVRHGTWPQGILMMLLSKKCQPLWPGEKIQIDHGVNIAELIKDVAPDATLFYAQANSPRQVYKAARWLDETKNVDVIVHAAGWAYDGKGDGTSPLGAASNWTFNESNPGWLTNEHSPYRYEPSPLKTVDTFTEDGPVWINAAGNMEKITMRKTGPRNGPLGVVGGTTAYKDFLVLNDTHRAVPGDTAEETAGKKACQHVPWKSLKIYVHSLRWADAWASSGPTANLDFFIVTSGATPSEFDDRAHANTTSGNDEQLSRTYPVRRTVKMAGIPDDEACLRIKVNRNSAGNLPSLPGWVQFQIITQDYETEASWNLGNDVDGHSIVNPASSASPNLLAMAARNMRSATIKLLMGEWLSKHWSGVVR